MHNTTKATSVTHIRTTLIDVALEPATGRAFNRVQWPSDGLGEPRISLLRCLARADYLDNVLGATERTLSTKALSGLMISIAVRKIVLEDKVFFALSVPPSSALLRLRTRLSRAIAPGLADGDDLRDPHAIWIPTQPVFVPEFLAHRISPFVVRTAAVSVYGLDYPRYTATKLLRRWPI